MPATVQSYDVTWLFFHSEFVTSSLIHFDVTVIVVVRVLTSLIQSWLSYPSGMGQHSTKSSYTLFGVWLSPLVTINAMIASTGLLCIICSLFFQNQMLIQSRRNNFNFHILPWNYNDAAISFCFSFPSITLSEMPLFQFYIHLLLTQ